MGDPYDPKFFFFWVKYISSSITPMIYVGYPDFPHFFFIFFSSYLMVIGSAPVAVQFCAIWGSPCATPWYLRLKHLLWCPLRPASPFMALRTRILKENSIFQWNWSFSPFLPFLPKWGVWHPHFKNPGQSQDDLWSQSEGPPALYQPHNVFWLLAPHTFLTRGPFWYRPIYQPYKSS